MVRYRLAAAFFLTLLVSAAPIAQEVHRAAADRAREKIDSIIANAENPQVRRTPARTLLSEVEINAYLLFNDSGALPNGVTRPEIRFVDDSRLRASAIVDLDEVRKSRQRSWNDPLAYVVGSVEVVALGRIAAQEGVGRAQIESATVAGITVPRSVVHELLRHYTVTPDQPEGIDLDKPFALPAGIHSVLVRRGGMTIVQ